MHHGTSLPYRKNKEVDLARVTPSSFERHYTLIMIFAAGALMCIAIGLNIFLFRYAQDATLLSLEKTLQELAYNVDMRVNSVVEGAQSILSTLDRKNLLPPAQIRKKFRRTIYDSKTHEAFLPLQGLNAKGCLIYGLPDLEAVPYYTSEFLGSLFSQGDQKISSFLKRFPHVENFSYVGKKIKMICPWNTFPQHVNPEVLSVQKPPISYLNEDCDPITPSWTAFQEQKQKKAPQASYRFPLIQRGKLVGIFQFTLSNTFFSQKTRLPTLPFGHVFLIDQKQTIFAQLNPREGKFVATYIPKNLWPTGLKKAHIAQKKQNNPGKLSFVSKGIFDGYWTYHLPLKDSSWTLMFLGNAFEVARNDISLTFSDSMLFLFALILMVGLSHRLVNVYFLRPAVQLINHLNNERQGLEKQIDVMPARWRPWANLISETFAENRALVDELESRVQGRTKALKEALEDLKRSQKQIIAQEKLASLGNLVAGIAHEIKNPLNFVINFADISRELIHKLSKKAPPPDSQIFQQLTQNMDKIIQYAQRADNIVKSMLLHARGDGSTLEETDLNRLLQEYTTLCHQSFIAKELASFPLMLETWWDPHMKSLLIYPQDIGRIFLNLLNNALQAVWERFSQEKSDPDEEPYAPQISIVTRYMEDKILFSVEDNGGGIPEHILNRIFDPFFTTKDPQKGTGLGLSLSYDCVQRHKGTITVENEPGQKVKFVVMIPRLLESQTTDSQKKEVCGA